jgi:hypothetical protein
LPEPTWGEFSAPATCATCHPQHVREWSLSSHAYALVDPVFVALVQVAQEETRGELGQFCTRCHSPFAVATGQTEVQSEQGVFRQNLSVGPIGAAGVSCDGCHFAVAVDTTHGALTIEPRGARKAGIRDPVANDFHASEYASLQGTSRFCGSCHDVFLGEGASALRVESTYSEWTNVPSTGTCQDCHMPTRTGRAATEGPERLVHDHRFVGVDVSLLPAGAFPGDAELRQAAQALLREQTLDLALSFQRGTLDVSLHNRAGHAVPSGATADRQLWLEVRVFARASGAEVFASGTLDARGDLRDDDPAHTAEPGTDPQLVVFRQRLLHDPALAQEQGPTREVHAVWQANAFEERLLAARETTTVHYDLTDLGPGSYRVEVRARYRAFPPYLLRWLEQRAGLDEAVRARLPIVDVQASTLDIEL